MALPAPNLERPPLESGDRLSREEFHRRYEQWPEIKKAELIDGIVYVGGRVTVEHSRAHGAIVGWLGVFSAESPDAEVLGPVSVVLPGDNEVQPDASLRRHEDGATRVREDGYLEGPPELIAEVAASSASYDLHQKRALYERSGVLEYVVWQVYDRAIRWFRLQDGNFVEVDPGEATTVESAIFPGLRLDREAMLAGDLATVLAAVQPR